MIINAIKKFIKKPFVGVPAPAYLEDDPWFGPATLSEKQLSIKEAREQLVEENQLVPESEVPEFKVPELDAPEFDSRI